MPMLGTCVACGDPIEREPEVIASAKRPEWEPREPRDWDVERTPSGALAYVHLACQKARDSMA